MKIDKHVVKKNLSVSINVITGYTYAEHNEISFFLELNELRN